MKPTLIIFSSGKSLQVANGIRDNLQDTFNVDIWTEGFFDEYNTIPLWVFFKKLMCYDFAVVILGGDDTRKRDAANNDDLVPRDNVIFELGATMSRLGPQKTFIFTPADHHVTLPTYFRGVMVFEYQSQGDARGSFRSATGSSCESIKRHLGTLSEEAFHSDLPAQGLAIGYFSNFIKPLYEGLREEQKPETDGPAWKPTSGFTLTCLIPDEIIDRAAADRLLKRTSAGNVIVRLFRDRDVSCYVLPRLDENEPLHILDIPTTLLTSSKVIEKIDSFWGNFGDTLFQHQLQQRELLSFARKLRAMRKDHHLDAEIVFVEPLNTWESHIKRLVNHHPPQL